MLPQEALISQGKGQHVLPFNPSLPAPRKVVETKHFAAHLAHLHASPRGDGCLPAVSAIANSDGAGKTVVSQSLGYQASGVGEVIHPSGGAHLLHKLRIAENSWDTAQSHGKSARAGGFLP